MNSLLASIIVLFTPTLVLFVVLMSSRTTKFRVNITHALGQLSSSGRVLYAVTVVFCVGAYWRMASSYSDTGAALLELTRWYALAAFAALGLALLSTALGGLDSGRQAKNQRVDLRSPLVRVAAMLGVAHAILAFFNSLDGSVGALRYLSVRHRSGVLFGAFAILEVFVLTVLTVAKWHRVAANRRQVHSFVLLIVFGLAVLLHAVLIGSDYTEPSGLAPVITITIGLSIVYAFAVGAIMIGLSRRLFRSRRWQILIPFVSLLVVSTTIAGWMYVRSNAIDPHAAHAGYSVDYVMKMELSEATVQAGRSTTALLSVTNATDGSPVQDFDTHQEKLMHVILVRSDLSGYQHLHPEYTGSGVFELDFSVPVEGAYTVYAQYVPATADGIQQLSSATFVTKNSKGYQAAVLSPPILSQVVDGSFRAKLDYGEQITSGKLTRLKVDIVDATTSEPVARLQPYLESFGHLVAISSDLAEFTHVHPLEDNPSQALGGPQITYDAYFMSPGTYRLYLQFKIDDRLRIAEFDVEVL